MKYMNQHFGQSRIFGRCRFKAAIDTGNISEPDASSNKPDTGGAGGSTSGADPDADGGGESEPTVAELMAQLAQERAVNERLKTANNKASSDAAKYKKQLNERLSAQEQLEAAKKEAEEANQAELKELRDWKQISEFVEECMDKDIGMDKATAKEFSEALVNGDSPKAFKALSNHIKALRATWEKEVDARSPEVKAGSGSNGNDLPVMLAEKLAKKSAPANLNGLDKWISGGKR